MLHCFDANLKCKRTVHFFKNCIQLNVPRNATKFESSKFSGFSIN